MKNKVLVGVLITTLGIGGMVYASGESSRNIKSIDYKVDAKNSIQNKIEDKKEFADNKTETRKDEDFRTCYGRGRNHRRLRDKELKESGDFSHHLGLSKEEYDSLTEAERKELFERVKENRNLSDREVEKLITSGSYCHYYDMTEEEYKKLTDDEKEELFKNNEYGGYRYYRRDNYRDSEGNLNRNYKKGSHHRQGYNRKGHHRRGYCH